MDIVDKNLTSIADSIRTGQYVEVETERFELKDLSKGWGDDWYKSVCSFLNTNGGVIVIGIQDKNNANPKHYKFTGYTNSVQNESHLKQDLPKKFTNSEGKQLDLSNHIYNFEIRDFLNGKIAVVYIDELPDDRKFVFYNGKAYRRKLTGDHELTMAEIQKFEEIKKEIIRNQELTLIKDASIDLIDLDKLNQYILRFNKGKKKGETLKATLDNAMSFLVREGFLRDNKPTLLGMLVCGNEVERFIQGKSESDCYVIVPRTAKVAQSKEIINDNIENLIEGSFNFVWRNIQVGVSYAKGGTASPEYPEELIRECINNAFAHRDYSSDRFVIIEIRPNESMMIRNPGAFERRQRISIDSDFGKVRRIIPIQVARNPKLTHLLKSFDYWEGKGRGLSSLIDTCLENEIDVPYYQLSDGEIRLFIPKGKVFDESMDAWLNSFSKYIFEKIGRPLSFDEKVMLSFFRKSELLNRLECFTILLTTDNNHKSVIADLEDLNLIFRHPLSPEIYPIYLIDRVLTKTDFSNELKQIFGSLWETLKPESKEILNAIHWFNCFSFPTNLVSANSIGTFLFSKQNKQIPDLNEFETFKRKVRNLFNQLEMKGFIVRKDGMLKSEGGKPDFKINYEFQNEGKLF